MPPQPLTDQDKAHYKQQLKHRSEKAFQGEFIRTTNLERELIDTFGFEGVQLILGHPSHPNYTLLGNFPEECPWAGLNGQSTVQAIELIFAPLKERLPQLLFMLKERCRFLFTEYKAGEWHLHYLLNIDLYDGRAYYRIYTGGTPLKAPEENANLQAYHWTLPDDLKAFYAVHNGFGENYDSPAVQRNDQLSVLATIMTPICQQQNILPSGYCFEDLLEFFPDGAGNAQCFIRNAHGNNDTVDWDHETWGLSGEQDFYTFIDNRLSQIDEA